MSKSRKYWLIVLVMAVMPVLATSAWAQSSTVLDNNTIMVTDPLGRIFWVRSQAPTSSVVLGESGEDVELRIKDPWFSVDQDAFYFEPAYGNLTLGSGSGLESGADGDLILKDNAGVSTLRLSGDSGGNATQSNTGEGFVKAWVKVYGGNPVSILSSYNVTSVSRQGPGSYHVVFSDTAFYDRPLVATLDGHNLTPSTGGISVGLSDGMYIGKQVLTYSASGTLTDKNFTLVVY